MQNMDGRDFIQYLGQDMSIIILMHLDDPSDIVRICAASSSWRHFVIANGIFKQLCLKKFPEISRAVNVIEEKNVMEPLKNGTNISTDWELQKRDYGVYGCLVGGLSTMRNDCIADAICASSTDNYPQESIMNTLEASNVIEHDDSTSYWSSKGENDPTIPETLVYKLLTKLCVVTEIYVQPFQAFFQHGFPTYAAKAVRFRMGHRKCAVVLDGDNADDASQQSTEEFIWTYTSQEFPMARNNSLQKFKLPEPAICIGGILQVELLGRVQRQDIDNLYYICVSNVQAVGRVLSSAFDVEILDPYGTFALKYCSKQDHLLSSSIISSEGETSRPSHFRRFTSRLSQRGARHWEQMLLHTLLGTGAIVGDDDESDDELFA